MNKNATLAVLFREFCCQYTWNITGQIQGISTSRRSADPRMWMPSVINFLTHCNLNNVAAILHFIIHFSLSRCQLSRRGRRRGLWYRQRPEASAVTGPVLWYLAVFNVVSSFYHCCYHRSYWLFNDTFIYYGTSVLSFYIDVVLTISILYGFTHGVFLNKMLWQKWRSKTVELNLKWLTV